MVQLSPIVLFVYNRLDHTTRTVEALRNNFLAPDSDLYIFSDGPKNSDAVASVEILRNYLTTISGFNNVYVRLRPNNLGVDENTIQGVTEVIDIHQKVIVLEDDLVTSPWFLQYMNGALDFYEAVEEVVSIHG